MWRKSKEPRFLDASCKVRPGQHRLDVLNTLPLFYDPFMIFDATIMIL